jgi:hypothetical protein
MLPIVQVPFIVFNGSFSSGLGFWTTGGPPAAPLGASWVANGGSPDGGGAAMLGSPSWNTFCAGGVAQPTVPIGNGNIAQMITVPNQPNPTLTFYYRIFTQDWTGSTNLTTAPPYDFLGAYAGGLDDMHHLFYAGNTDQSKGTGCAAPYDMGWQRSPPLSLAQYQGKTVTLYFAVWNQVDNYYNTYAYVDGITVSFGG